MIFDKFDADQDGYLSSEDIRKVLLTYGQLSSEGELQEVVAEFDKKSKFDIRVIDCLDIKLSKHDPFVLNHLNCLEF